MNDLGAAGRNGFLTTSELAGRSDFLLGNAIVSPSRRVVSGSGGIAEVEPRVMQVLVVLADAAGSVVTRQTLFDRCWGASDVGDDSLNRAIAAVRKLASEVAGCSFEIETIPRTGYRLTAEAAEGTIADPAGRIGDSAPSGISRRTAIGATTATLLAGAAGAYVWSSYSKNRKVSALVERGTEGLDYGDGSIEPAEYLREAVALDPDNSFAQGLLASALALSSDNLDKSRRQAIVKDADRAAKASLAIDPANVNAKLAMLELAHTSLDLASTEDRLRALLAADSANIYVMRELWSLLQSAGRSREALALVNRAISIKPLAASNNFPLGQLLWIVGRVPEADRVLERALSTWPEHRFVRFARFNLLAYTGRARAALAMLESQETAPQHFSPEAVALLRMSLAALIEPTPANRDKARSASMAAVERNPALTRVAVLPLAALGEVDAAFAIANKLFVFDLPGRGGTSRGSSSSLAWRFAPWLFTPPAASMRADPRFARLCEGAGLTAYWRERNIKPDYLVFPG